jgi:superfamily II DNA or RNA helicase
MAKHNPQVKYVDLGELDGRDAQNAAQAAVTKEFMNTDMYPNYRLMANFATGVGKGKAAMETTAEFSDKVCRGKKTLIGCHTVKQRDNMWPKQVAKWGRMHPFTGNLQVECYKSFKNISGQDFGMLILDEFHHVTEEIFTFFSRNTVEGILILTATEPKDTEKKKMINQLTAGRRIVIKVDQAIEAGIINDFEVNVMWIELNNTEHFKMFKTNNTLYTDRTGYLKHCGLVTQAKMSSNPDRIRATLINRIRYLGNTNSKTMAAKYIQRQFKAKDMRFITVAASIEQCEQLSENTFHSERDDKCYKAFIKGEIDHLVSVNMIREGENFDNLGRCLLIQPDRNPGNFDQLAGRCLRLPVGMLSKMIIIAAKDTQDQTIITEALKYVNPNRIKHYELPESKYWTK